MNPIALLAALVLMPLAVLRAAGVPAIRHDFSWLASEDNDPTLGCYGDLLAQPDGLAVFKDYRATPDLGGALPRVPLRLPGFAAACCFSPDGNRYLSGANRVLPWVVHEFADLPREGAVRNRAVGQPGSDGLFALMQLRTGGWLALLPLAGDETMANLNMSEDGALSVVLKTAGRAPVAGLNHEITLSR